MPEIISLLMNPVLSSLLHLNQTCIRKDLWKKGQCLIQWDEGSWIWSQSSIARLPFRQSRLPTHHPNTHVIHSPTPSLIPKRQPGSKFVRLSQAYCTFCLSPSRTKLTTPVEELHTGAQLCQRGQFKKHYNHMRRNVSGLIISTGEWGKSLMLLGLAAVRQDHGILYYPVSCCLRSTCRS